MWPPTKTIECTVRKEIIETLAAPLNSIFQLFKNKVKNRPSIGRLIAEEGRTYMSNIGEVELMADVFEVSIYSSSDQIFTCGELTAIAPVYTRMEVADSFRNDER